MHTCPECESTNIETKQEQRKLHYGDKEISVEIPVRYCQDCKLEYLDHEAEYIQEEAIKKEKQRLSSARA